MYQLGPIQFDVQKLWNHSKREILASEAVLHALVRIQDRWIEVARFKYEENSPHDEETARKELELDIHIGETRLEDLVWLREQFESEELTDLALAIAQAVMPQKAWEIIEGLEHEVVTDSERSIVFDIKYGGDLSAGASLLLSRDPKYQPTQVVCEELAGWARDRATRLSTRVGQIRNDLERFNKPGELITLLD